MSPWRWRRRVETCTCRSVDNKVLCISWCFTYFCNPMHRHAAYKVLTPMLIPEFFRLLGYYAAWGGFKPTFRDYLSAPSSRVKFLGRLKPNSILGRWLRTSSKKKLFKLLHLPVMDRFSTQQETVWQSLHQSRTADPSKRHLLTHSVKKGKWDEFSISINLYSASASLPPPPPPPSTHEVRSPVDPFRPCWTNSLFEVFVGSFIRAVIF
jgi:hypothetical protein